MNGPAWCAYVDGRRNCAEISPRQSSAAVRAARPNWNPVGGTDSCSIHVIVGGLRRLSERASNGATPPGPRHLWGGRRRQTE